MTVPARSAGTGSAQAPGTGVPAPADAPVTLVAPPTAAELVASAAATWRADLVEAAGGSTLADVEELGEAALDLTAAHPSGLAQLFAGRPTRLSSLVREGSAATTARRRARAVCARAGVYTQQYGIAPTSLALGVATWVERSAPTASSDDVATLVDVARRGAGSGAGSGSVVGTVGPADDEAYDDLDETTRRRPDALPRVMRAPVLLRPVTLRPRGTGETDHELLLEPTIEVNPVLARALRSRGALLDPDAVARGTFTTAGFDPRGALKRLAALGEAVLEDFRLTERLVVGTFVHPGQMLVDDLDALGGSIERHEVLAALAGVEAAREELARPLPEPPPGDRDPRTERGVGDLDPQAQHLLDLVAAGHHLFVDAPAGSDVTGALAALVADAAADGRTVLYVPGHRRAAVALSERLTALGVGDLLLDVAPDAGWRTQVGRRLLGAMTLEPDAVDPVVADGLRRSLVEHREALRGYVRGLHARRQPWGVSAYDALQHLAALTAVRPAPRTTVRLAPEVARVLDDAARGELGADLVRAGELGAFSLRPSDTAWYGADVRTDADARVLLRRIDRLLRTGLPELVEHAGQVVTETGLTPPASLADWAEQMHMLDEVRASLDVFQPMVFERTAADMVAATATNEWRERHAIDMPRAVRRRLVKQARDLVRPGRSIPDLHTALVEVQRRREAWQVHCPGGGWPRLPDGLEAVEAENAVVRADLDALDAVLAGTPGGGGLTDLPWDALTARLERLRDDADALVAMPARAVLLRKLRGAGLGDLVDDLTARRVAPALAPAELDLAWWSTVLEEVFRADPALATYDGGTLELLVRRYGDLDRAHVAALAAPVRSAVVRTMSQVLREHREQAEALFGELVEERLTSLRDASARYPDVVWRLRPVVAASPMVVPQMLPPTRTMDLVVLDAAAHLPVEVALAAIARGRQVVVVGDPRCASGSAVRELAAVLPSVVLHADASLRDPWLTAFLARHGYADVLVPVPLPDARPLVELVRVDGTGLPGVESGIVDSPHEEVERVVELVLEHALTRPDESLAVVAVTPRHADAVRDRVLTEARDNPALAAFFDSARREPFAVVDLAAVGGLRRDAVLVTLGLGRTPHRRVLHSFGVVSRPGGDRLLLDAVGSTRHRLTVVACFGGDDLDPARLRGPGPRLLADLLSFAERRGRGDADPLAAVTDVAADEVPKDVTADEAPVDEAPMDEDGAARASSSSAEPDRLVVDLAERLWQHGLTVEVAYGLPGGELIPMAVGHPDVPDRLLVAVLIDDQAYVDEPSVRVRDRLTAARLERLGWTVLRVWSAAVFLDPQAEVDRIRRAVHAALPPEPLRPAPSPRVAPRLVHDAATDDLAPEPAPEPEDEPENAAPDEPADQVPADPAPADTTHSAPDDHAPADPAPADTTDHALDGPPSAEDAPEARTRRLGSNSSVRTDDLVPNRRVRGDGAESDPAERHGADGGSVEPEATDGGSVESGVADDEPGRRAAFDPRPVEAPAPPSVPVTVVVTELPPSASVPVVAPAKRGRGLRRGRGRTPMPAITPSGSIPIAASGVPPRSGSTASVAPGASATHTTGTSPVTDASSAAASSARHTDASVAPPPTRRPAVGKATASPTAIASPGAPTTGQPAMFSIPVPVVAPAPPTVRTPTAPVRVSSGVQRAVSRPHVVGVQLSLAVPSAPRPDVRRGLPIGAYSDDQLDELLAWLRTDGQERSRDELADMLREELGLTRRNQRVDSTIRAAIARALS